jgi:(E)-4-hydroxy-3-methylbut-2-enyl-diphosphate synthase
MATEVNPLYIPSFLSPVRRLTREVRVGDVVIGGNHPIVVQSMTTHSTLDTEATVNEIRDLVNAGCEIVRVTTPAMSDVENLPNIRSEMKRLGIRVPLVADVHFLPQVARKACEYAEKVRINPGNFADRKRFAVIEYTDGEYGAELERIREAFVPLVRRAKELGVSMRIGTNHGSLSDRIVNRFGDTPLGMVESALEFLRIAGDEGYGDIVLSMKASNPQVMIAAYRLLVARMNELKMDYPLHVGVTEAGEGDDGRIKSAVGIASLLMDGLGDTVRVSLTEDSVNEIPVARRLIELFARPVVPASTLKEDFRPTFDPYAYNRRPADLLSNGVIGVGGKEPVRVRTHVSADRLEEWAFNRANLTPPPESVLFETSRKLFLTGTLRSVDINVAVSLRLGTETPGDLMQGGHRFDELSLVSSPAWAAPDYLKKFQAQLGGRPVWLRVRFESELASAIPALRGFHGKIPAGVELEGSRLVTLGRKAAWEFSKAGISVPIHLHFMAPSNLSEEAGLLKASGELGSLLCDGIGDSIEISSTASVERNHRLSFNILQAARLRMSKAEYISCPSCGRTLFDLQETTARIREKTDHLKGVKIAVMGCIVNGPGEMADADFGYVGSGPGFVSLYVGKECVERRISAVDADRRLIELIKENGKWVDPPASGAAQP